VVDLDRTANVPTGLALNSNLAGIYSKSKRAAVFATVERLVPP